MKHTAQSGWQEPLHVQCARDWGNLTGRAMYHLRKDIQATLENQDVSTDVPLAWRQTSGTVLYGKGGEMTVQSWNLRPLEHPCKGRDGRHGSPDAFSLSRNKERSNPKELYLPCLGCQRFSLCNCCFDLCLLNHKQAPYQNHPQGKKWSRELDMWASVSLHPKTLASMQSPQRLMHFHLKQVRISNLISELSSLFQSRT